MRNRNWNVLPAVAVLLLLSMFFNETTRAETDASVESCSLTCDAGPSVSAGRPPLSVTFLSTVNAPGCNEAVSYHWEIKDGDQLIASSKKPIFSYTFISENQFKWNFTATSGTQSCSKSENIFVYSDDGSLSAKATPFTGHPPLDVNFYANGGRQCGYHPAYEWIFDDGSTSTEQNPTRKYSSSGLKSWQVKSWYYELYDCWGPYTISGKILVEDNCIKIGGLSLCADRKTKDPDSETYTFSGNVNLDGKLLFTNDVVFKAPSAGASKGVLTTSGSVAVKLKIYTE